jgi:hypothetical protein
MGNRTKQETILYLRINPTINEVVTLSIIENENTFLFEDRSAAYERLNVTLFNFYHVLNT